MSVNATARSLLLSEFVSAFFLAMRYFFKPKPTLNYPFETSEKAIEAIGTSELTSRGDYGRSMKMSAKDMTGSITKRKNPVQTLTEV
jgi:hypothetical protein